MAETTATTYTPTALKRWSCQDKQLPPPSQIKSLHIYDFDNTLFSSPLPNKQIWNTGTCGQIQGQDFLFNGGWWHNPDILAATGKGVEKEEERAWEGYWNEQIVDLVRLSMADKDTLNVLLTGRSEKGFASLISRMVASKKLEFDMVCLKPSSSPSGKVLGSTMLFKQALLRDMVFTYEKADELRIYEDRPKHVKGFRDFFAELNTSLLSSHPAEAIPVHRRQPIIAEVVQVSEQETTMEPASEVKQVQKMINASNQAILDGTAPKGQAPYKIKRSVFYTGYLISPPDIDKLRSLVKLPANCPEHEIRHLANNILITPRPAPPSILDKVGGIGAKLTWKVTGLASYEQRVWAARVQPTTPGAKVYTENHTPCVVLATRRQTKPIEASRIQNWQPVPAAQAFTFETTVGEKVLLRIEEEVANEDDYESSFPNAKNARKRALTDDSFPSQPRNHPASTRLQRSAHVPSGPAWQHKPTGAAFSGPRGGGLGTGRNAGGARGGRGDFRGGRGRGDGRGGVGGGGRGRGRGGYRSLDDNPGQGYGSGGMQY